MCGTWLWIVAEDDEAGGHPRWGKTWEVRRGCCDAATAPVRGEYRRGHGTQIKAPAVYAWWQERLYYPAEIRCTVEESVLVGVTFAAPRF